MRLALVVITFRLYTRESVYRILLRRKEKHSILVPIKRQSWEIRKAKSGNSRMPRRETSHPKKGSAKGKRVAGGFVLNKTQPSDPWDFVTEGSVEVIAPRYRSGFPADSLGSEIRGLSLSRDGTTAMQRGLQAHQPPARHGGSAAHRQLSTIPRALPSVARRACPSRRWTLF